MELENSLNQILAAQIPLRHSVRSFTDKRIEGETLALLEDFIADCNMKSGLSLQLVTDEPKAFSNLLARYGSFKNVKNYIACVGQKSESLQENAGYWGEHCVLYAQSLGLNTCWVAATYSKGKTAATIRTGEKLVCVIALGYGVNDGSKRNSKSATDVSNVSSNTPQWFYDGVKAALLAPTAMNQQKFYITYDNGTVNFKRLSGAYSHIDLGIVKSHFELGAGRTV